MNCNLLARMFVGFCLISCAVSNDALANETKTNDAKRPNIIIIMSDDMGYSDIGCYGGEIETPVLNDLATNGLRFTQFYNTGRCCPTRASLLTGLYPHQAGIGWMMSDQGLDGYRGDLNRQCVTIAEAMQTGGYQTYAVGKWHVTKHVNPKNESQKSNWPQQRGFDHYYGIINGASSLWDPNSLVRGNELITCVNDPIYAPDEPYHFTDAVSDNAAMFINQHETDKPFFMYVAYTAAHWPMHARARDIKKYDGKYDVGYGPIRERRLEKMKKLGLVDEQVQMSRQFGNWDEVPDQEWEAACMETYAAMIDQMDQGIGRIVSALRTKGELENTLIMFLQDNGGCAEGAGRNIDPARVIARAEKPTLEPIPKDLVHYFGSEPKQTRDGWPVRRGHVMPGPADTYIGYGRNWANVSNTPLREFKHWVHEGGIATPLIVHWPTGIEAKNELRTEPSHLIDLMATCLDVGDIEYPKQFNGNSITPLEGKSLVPVFNDQKLDRKAIFWEHEGHRAVRNGKWKLVAKGQMRDRSQPVKWELYDLDADRSELNNLAETYPDRVNDMSTQWQDYAVRAKVFPAPKPKPNANPKNKAELINRKNWKVLSVDSQETGLGNTVQMALDGDPKTMWHTEWQIREPEHPHSFVIDLGAPNTVRGVRILNRQDESDESLVRRFEIYASDDANKFETKRLGSLGKSKAEQQKIFSRPLTGRYIKFVSLTGHDDSPFASFAEFMLIGQATASDH